MRIVPLAPVSNQSFTVTLENVRWGIAVKSARGVMCVDIAQDGQTRLSGVRALPGEPLIPYPYLQTGNFLFLTLFEELPDYSRFGVSQFLVYLSSSEISSIGPITAGQISQQTETVEYLTTDDGFYITTDTGELLTND